MTSIPKLRTEWLKGEAHDRLRKQISASTIDLTVDQTVVPITKAMSGIKNPVLDVFLR